MPMQYAERTNRVAVEMLSDKPDKQQQVEPTKPQKPLIDERPPKPQGGQQILID